jgi:hypothetical protein
MSPTIPAAPRCAGNSCDRIDLVPSLLAAGAWLWWLATACTVTWFAVALPWLLRFVFCAAIASSGMYSLRTFVLLAGPRAIRAIEWNEAGEWSVYLGTRLARCPATLSAGSFRLGLRFWVLRFATPEGPRSVMVEEAPGATHAYRRLTRRLEAHLRRGTGRYRRPAVTIRPKV